MIKMRDALQLISKHRKGAVVIPTMTAVKEWIDISDQELLDLPVSGAMGKAASVALGVCLARPDKKVIVIDGDGSLLTNLGTLVTVSGQAPNNICHFVLDNGCYAVTGGQPVPNSGSVDFSTLASGAGYREVFRCQDLEDLATNLNDMMNATGPVFASLKIEPEIENTPLNLRPKGRTRRTPEVIKIVKHTLAQ